MRSTSAVTTALILLLGIGVAEAANPTLLAETGGFLLGIMIIAAASRLSAWSAPET
jgi:hypothetical protein